MASMVSTPIAPGSGRVDRSINTSSSHEHVVSIVHDLSGRLGLPFLTEHHTVTVGPSALPTPVRVESRVIGYVPVTPDAGRSPAYAAVMRRRSIGVILKAISLRHFSKMELFDLELWGVTFSSAIDQLIRDLQSDRLEGATRESLRRIRNTTLNGGVSNYARPEVGTAVVASLQLLADSDRVDSKIVSLVMAKLKAVKADRFPLKALWDIEDEPGNEEKTVAD